MSGKCPKCDEQVNRLVGHAVDAEVILKKAVTLSCPSCHTILGAQLDPIAVKTETVNDIIRELRKR